MQLAELEARLLSVEYHNRWLRRIVGGLVSFVIVAVICGAAGKITTFENLRLTSGLAVGAAGAPRVTVNTIEAGSSLVLGDTRGKPGISLVVTDQFRSLVIHDLEGRERMRLAIGEGAPEIALLDENGKSRFAVTMNELKTGIRIENGTADTSIWLAENGLTIRNGEISVRRDEGKPAFVMTPYTVTGFDEEGWGRVRLLNKAAAPSLEFQDSQSRSRLKIGLGKGDTPRIQFLNENEKQMKIIE